MNESEIINTISELADKLHKVAEQSIKNDQSLIELVKLLMLRVEYLETQLKEMK
jgi:hypothetical protein